MSARKLIVRMEVPKFGLFGRPIDGEIYYSECIEVKWKREALPAFDRIVRHLRRQLQSK